MSKVPYEPRNPITFKVEKDGGTEVVELPFVVGVLMDGSGNKPGKDKVPLKDARPVDVSPSTFGKVMNTVSPGLSIRVKNHIDEDGSELQVVLDFRDGMTSFGPDAIVEQVEPLRALRELREKLTQLHLVGDRSVKFEENLEKIVQDPEQRKKILGLLRGKTVDAE